MSKIHRLAATVLSMLLAVGQPGFVSGQTVQAPVVPTPQMQVVVVEGEAAIHNVRERKPTEIVVLVRDGNRRPIPQATVTFTLPAEGSSGTFPKGAKTITVTSDKDGYAVARGLTPNNVPGPFRVEVTAEHQGQMSRTMVTQFNMNVAAKKGGSGKLIAILGITGAAAAGAAVYALRNSGTRGQTGTPPTPIGITPGPGTVGPPR